MATAGGVGLFESYEQDYSTLASSITRKLNTQLPSLVGEPRKALLRTLEREVEEADEILHSMEMELGGVAPATKNRLQPKLRQYRADYDRILSTLKAASAKGSDRDQLLSDGFDASGDVEVATMDQRQRLLTGTNRLQDASKRLADSHRIALETEEIGAQTLGTLRNQREQIVRANERLDETNSFMDRNVRLLKDMSRRMATNRVLSIVIIIVLLLIIILVLYIRFK